MRMFVERFKQPLENDELLALVKERKLRWFRHISKFSGLAKPVLKGTVKRKRINSRQENRWEDNIREWTEINVFASSAIDLPKSVN